MSGALTRTDILDHLIYLVEPGKLDEGVARFKSLGFNVIPGGTHADNLTSNALIILPSGVYIELIAFIHPVSYYDPNTPEYAARVGHWWANKTAPGWIDYSHLDVSPDPSTLSTTINARAAVEKSEKEEIFDAPQVGGRKRPDGVALKWAVTFPKSKYGRGVVPFFCQDLTPRDLRVPLNPPSNSTHTNSAQGIAHVEVRVSKERFKEYRTAISATLGSEPTFTSSESETTAVWALSAPGQQQGAPAHSELVLTTGEGGDGVLDGISKVTFWVKEGAGAENLESSSEIAWKNLQ